MKKLLFMLFAVACMQSQTITINNTTNTPEQLVNLLLGNSCVQVSNITISSNQSVAYFNNNGSSFPIAEGVVIRSGNVLQTQGNYNPAIATLSTPAVGGGTDAFLQNLSNISSGTSVALQDLAFIEFDFIPVSTSFSFDFLFASNEYGQFQCLSNDIFAFKLTNLSTNVTTNLGVLPGTNTPVSVKTIKNSLFNNTCSSTNPNLFSVYNVNNIPASTLNMRGHTTVLNASSGVIPNTPYRLRLIISDYGDADYDSAVFISAGSFTNTLDLGPDITLCDGNTFVLNTLLDNTYTYQWFLNGAPIIGANSSTYTVTTAGTYSVEITKGTCLLTDSVVVNNLLVTPPNNLLTCNTGAANYVFNVTQNNETTLGINNAIYDLFYYASAADAASNTPITSPTNFNTAGNTTVYIRIFNTQTNQFCDAIYPFDLIITNATQATSPAPVTLCDNPAGIVYDLTNLNAAVLNGQLAANYTVTYHNSLAEAQNGSNPFTQTNLATGTTTATIYIRVQDNSNATCFATTTVTLNINPLPSVSTLTDVVECSSYVLPVIANGNYFDGPNGTGTQLFAGNTINQSGTYYIFAGPDANGCTNQTTFNAFFIDEYVPQLNHCGTFVVPTPPFNIGAFYTAPGGPTGTGTLVPTGTSYSNTTQNTTNVTLYYYALVNGVLCRDEQFIFNIFPIPLADDPTDVTFCNSYTLPALTNGNYYTEAGGAGIPLFAGNVITSTQTIYVFAANANCNVSNPFQVNIVDTTQFTNISSCNSYTLPPISFGGYYTAPMGGGTPIDPNIPITTSQVVYYYTNTTILPNCTDNLNYNITINPLPIVDQIPSATYCGSYTLPVLSNGSYYTVSGGPTAAGQVPLFANQVIDLSGDNLAPGTYYIYNGPDANGCTIEWAFTINITPLPVVTEYINQVVCNPYSIPAPAVGQIYTAPNGPNGTGTLVSPSDVFNEDRRFYVYFQDPLTSCVADVPFEMFYNGINLPNYQDVNVCNTYTLPVLTHVPPEPTTSYTIGYFYNIDGTNPVPNGTVFNATNTPVTVYVYAQNNGRFGIQCIEVDAITITVSDTPNLASLNLVFDPEACGSYTLPTLPTTSYNINYYTAPGGNPANLVTNLTFNNTTGASENYTYYVYASAFNNANCNNQISFNFTVHPLLTLDLPDGVICVDPTDNAVLQTYTINTGLSPAIYTVEYFLNNTLVGTGPSYEASVAGVYDIRFTKLIPDVGNNCNYENTTVTITQSGPAVANFTVNQEFQTANTFINVNITGGFGNYVYQLVYPDGTLSATQSSNVFNNLPTGEYFVNIFDTLGGCGPSSIGPIYIVNYPNFFTPNADGYNDRWNIFDLSYDTNAVVNIFDRYGKFLKQFSTTSAGWDGTYNGNPLPSTDYWFTVEYTSQNSGNKAVFKSHFTLKR
jgi:gliding motility-associated-like protein